MLYLFNSPLGPISYDWDGHTCHRIWLDDRATTSQRDDVSQWFQAYFQGDVLSLPKLATAKTAFQKRMRDELITIKLGSTSTYGEFAKILKTSPRALGQALGANPFLIMVPCHRILSLNGLGGFAFGLPWKQKLLAFENDS